MIGCVQNKKIRKVFFLQKKKWVGEKLTFHFSSQPFGLSPNVGVDTTCAFFRIPLIVNKQLKM